VIFVSQETDEEIALSKEEQDKGLEIESKIIGRLRELHQKFLIKEKGN